VFIITWYKICWFGYKVIGYISLFFLLLLTFEPIIGGGKYYSFFGVSCNSTRITLGKNKKYLVFCNNYKAKKTVPCDIIRILFVSIHEDLILPLVTISKKKNIRSAKESNNIIINTKKQQRLIEIAINRN
jgi:hypothetical protein